jgi:hypothetical protein
MYRNNYLDEIPEPKINRDDPEYVKQKKRVICDHPEFYKLKCRPHSVASILMTIQSSIEQGVIKDKVLIEEGNLFVTQEWNAMKKDRWMYTTTKEEVEKLNKIMDRYIMYIKENYKI